MNPAIESIYRKACTSRAELRSLSGDASAPPIEFVHVFKKTYPRLPRVRLPDDGRGRDLVSLLHGRRSVRDFRRSPIRFSQLSNILRSCEICSDVAGSEKRTYPSAGARFPVEIYPVVFDVDGVEPGVYHYSMSDNVLECLLHRDTSDDAMYFVSSHVTNAAAALILTTVISRSEVKYGAKAYPFSLIEAGHMGQNILIASAVEGVGACPVGGYACDAIIEALDLTPGELPIYVVALGSP